MEEYVVNDVMTVTDFKEKSSMSASDADIAAGDGDAVVDVVSPCLLQDQKKTVCEFKTPGQQESEEVEVVDTESDLSFCTCSSDVSEVMVELVQTDAVRMCANTVEQSLPYHEEPHISELESVPEMENATGSEITYEFSLAECCHRPEASATEDMCTFLEGTTAPEVPELTPENVAEPSEIEVCLEMAELHEKAATKSADQLLEIAEESVNDDVEEVPASEQVEGCEILSEVVEAELRQLLASETGAQNWSLESDEVDDLFEMAYEDKLTPEEIQPETVALENKTQAVSSSSDQLLPDVFDGTTEDIADLDTENMDEPPEILSDTVLLESKSLESWHVWDQELTVIDEEGEVKEVAQEFEESSVSPDEILPEFVVAEASGLKTMNTLQEEAPGEEDHPTEDLTEYETMSATCGEIQNEFVEPSCMTVSMPHSVTSQQEAPGEEEHPTEVLSECETMSATCDEVANEFLEPTSMTVSMPQSVTSQQESAAEEEHPTEELSEYEDMTATCDEIQNEFVEPSSMTVYLQQSVTLQQESTGEEQHPTEELSECETMTATSEEIKSEFLEPSSMTLSLQQSVSDAITEVNERDEYTDVTAVDEEWFVEPEEISSSLVTTSLVPKEEYLTPELLDELSVEDTTDGEVGPEAEILPEGTTVDSPLVSDETVKAQVQSYSSQQISEIEEDNVGDGLDELHGDNVEAEVIENPAAEAGSARDLPESCVAVVKEEHTVEEFSDLTDDVTRTNFVLEAMEDDSTVSDSSFLPVTTMPSTEFESTSSLPKIEQQTPEQQQRYEEEPCSELEDGVMVAEPVVSEVIIDLDTAQIADEPDVYEMYVEEEVTVEEKITESMLTTVYGTEAAGVEMQDEDITIEGTQCCSVCMA